MEAEISSDNDESIFNNMRESSGENQKLKEYMNELDTFNNENEIRDK